jgi:hypothetical protein
MSLILTIKLLYLQEIVALSGAHTLGRSRPERSGWGKPETKYTVYYFPFLSTSYKHDFARVLIFDIEKPMS